MTGRIMGLVHGSAVGLAAAVLAPVVLAAATSSAPPPSIAPADAPAAADAPAEVRSPDGRLSVRVDLRAGTPTWRADRDGRPLLRDGALGLELTDNPLRPPFELAAVEHRSADSTWRPVAGDRSEVRDRFNECAVTVREARPAGRRFLLVLRAYDEGFAVRYEVPRQDGWESASLRRRLTEFAFAGDPAIYQNRNYEYGVPASRMSRSEGAVTVDAGSGRWVCLTDADRAGFPESPWAPSKTRGGTIAGGLRSPAVRALPMKTSWEVAIVADSAAGLYENRHLVENLSPPCAIADVSWIRPGKAICQVRNTRMVTAELKRLMDFASANGFEHVEIDHSWCGAETRWTPEEVAFFQLNHSAFWRDKPEWRDNVGGNPTAPARGWVPFRPKADSGGNFVDLDVAALAAYGKALSPPVGVCLYLRAAVVREFGGEHPADDVFSVYRKWGVAGIKLGFVPTGSARWEGAIADVVRKAADHRLLVNIHDAYLPAGLSRTYPNLLNVEGVAGEEAEHSIPPDLKSRHDVMLMFTRCLMGPVDYTPECYKKNSPKTHAHQVALIGAYPGRPSVRGGMRQWSPGGEGGSEIEFVRRLPALFDQTRVVTADIGRFVTVARRRGDTWFVATLGDGQPHTLDLKLDFLRPGAPYRATTWADAQGTPRTTRSTGEVTAASSLKIALQPNGGHLMILEPAAAPTPRP